MSALTVDQVKAYLRYDSGDTSQDTTLALIIAAAQRWVENYTGHILVERDVTESPVAFPTAPTGQKAYHDLRYKPADIDTLEIAYLDADLAEQTFTTFTAFLANGTYRIVADTSWPSDASGIAITYTAGYAEVADIPEDLIHAMLLYAGMSDQDRAETNSMAWKALDAILTHYRLPVLA